MYLDPAEPDTVAEFAVWYVRHIPDSTSEVSLFAMDFGTNIKLTADTTIAEIIGVLAAA